MKMSMCCIALTASLSCLVLKTEAQTSLHKLKPVDFSRVTIEDNFWKPRIEAVSKVTIPVCIYQTEVKTGRIRNFEKVASRKGERHEGIFYDDSDVYKALEAITYSLKNNPDPELEKKADEWIDKIAAAQQPDGYLNTFYTLEYIENRWTNMDKHEDYCAGHLIEAAGSKALADINLDGIGVKPPEQAGHLTNVTRYTSPEGERLADMIAGLNTHHALGLEQSKYHSESPGDDDGSFINAGFPWSVLNIGSMPYGDPNYHTEGDVAEKVDIRNAKVTVQLTLAAILHLDIFGRP